MLVRKYASRGKLGGENKFLYASRDVSIVELIDGMGFSRSWRRSYCFTGSK